VFSCDKRIDPFALTPSWILFFDTIFEKEVKEREVLRGKTNSFKSLEKLMSFSFMPSAHHPLKSDILL
jgi:hypothetical protein